MNEPREFFITEVQDPLFPRTFYYGATFKVKSSIHVIEKSIVDKLVIALEQEVFLHHQMECNDANTDEPCYCETCAAAQALKEYRSETKEFI